MYIIGLYGMAGSGKSTVAKFFEEKGWLVIHQDQLGHQVLQENVEQIVTLFGSNILDNGVVNRSKLGAKVFSDDTLRQQLMTFSYPIIINKTNEIIQQSTNTNIIIEGALFYKIKDRIPYTHLMYVQSDESLLRQRLLTRGHTIEWIDHILFSQQEILEHKDADFIITNNDSLPSLKKNLINILQQLI